MRVPALVASRPGCFDGRVTMRHPLPAGPLLAAVEAEAAEAAGALTTAVSVLAFCGVLAVIGYAFWWVARRLRGGRARSGGAPARGPVSARPGSPGRWRVRDFPATAPERLPRRWPRPGQIHYAAIPFDDGTGAKDRPCLVLAANDREIAVAKITSREYPPRRPLYLPPGTVDDRHGRASYLEPESVYLLPRSAFRRSAGRVGKGLWSQVMERVG